MKIFNEKIHFLVVFFDFRNIQRGQAFAINCDGNAGYGSPSGNQQIMVNNRGLFFYFLTIIISNW